MTKSHPARGGGEKPMTDSGAAVVGTLDSALRIERVSGEARALFDRPLEMLIGQSILTLMVEEDVPTFLVAYAEAAASQKGVTVELGLGTSSAHGSSQTVLCDVFVVPLRPAPGCAFVLRTVTAPALGLADCAAVPGASDGCEHARVTPQSSHGILRGVAVHSVPGVGRLTTRERQIVSRLLDGHRPPGIARALFLSQSTVRNHLASVFRKLGVTSQEALLELFRESAMSPGPESAPSPMDGQISRTS